MTDQTATTGRALPKLPAGAAAVLPTVWLTFVTTVVLALAFSFGNVWDLGRAIGVERHVAPLIGPAVDLTAIGLLVVVPWFVLAGIAPEQLRAANRLMRLAGFLTLALNSGPSAIAGWAAADPRAWGRALVEAIVPTLLIAWSHVGPGLIALFVEVRQRHADRVAETLRKAQAEDSRLAEERTAEIAAAAEGAVAEALERAAAESAGKVDSALSEIAAQLAEVQASERGYRTELDAALASEKAVVAELDATREALEADRAAHQETVSKLREEIKAARRKPLPSGSRKPAERAPRRTHEEWVDLAKERLPEWQMETPTGSVIGSALDLSSAGTISKIRQQLETDRIALTNSGGTS